MNINFNINYCKPKIINLDGLVKEYQENYQNTEFKYNPYNIQNLQLYNPIYNRLFKLNENNFSTIALNHPYHMNNLHSVTNSNETFFEDKPVFVKFSPLLDPYRYMVGKYDVDDNKIRTMPRFDSTEESVFSKILDANNAAYVDCFFNYLSCMLLHNHNFVHGIDFYGSYVGLQEKHRVCITDDLDFLRNSTFFNDNIGKLFFIEDFDRTFYDFNDVNSRRNKQKLVFDDDDDDNISIECDELSAIDFDNDNDNVESNTEIVYVKKSNTTSSSSNSISSYSDSDLNYSSDDDDDNDDDDDDDDDESRSSKSGSSSSSSSSSESDSYDEEVYGYINNFPVQMICMEKCNGTLDELFISDDINLETGASILFQVIMSLIVYQRVFNLTHNDLHTNNIMYINTEITFLYYKYEGITYKVPTYGKIIKIIDFGRGIYKFQGNIFCSDSFGPDGDAVTQYNIKPFLNKNRPIIEPNNSFDLCRLGSSIFDFIMDIDTDVKDMDELQKTIHRWCLDDNGKNVLYKRNGEERYPSFKLYKMIARTVHNHTPERQLNEPLFNQFKSDDVQDDKCMDIDQMPRGTHVPL